MLDALRGWVLTITATALLCALARALTPKNGKKAVGVACAFAMMAAMLGICGDVDALGVGMYVEQYRAQADETVKNAQERARSETRFIIEARCEAYILDKAAALGVPLDGVSVTAKWSGEGFWYPDGCALRGDESRELSRVIEAELGISMEKQIWSTQDGT